MGAARWPTDGRNFADAVRVFAGPVLTQRDSRRKYGEPRFVTLGVLKARLVVLVWTPRDGKRRIISMRYANDNEKDRFEKFLG
ncbi:MAG: BrnT family toxin [Desulfobulbaceae bacterium]|nr:BrnT family toxin [Desulfobulbaceae bacterium]